MIEMGGAMDTATIVAMQEREERWTDELLAAASERIAFGWVQRSMGVTLDGKPQMTTNEETIGYCLMGALSSAADALGADVYTLRRAERLLSEALGMARWNPSGVMAWNDHLGRGKDDVLQLIDKALSRRVSLAPAAVGRSADRRAPAHI
jgi:hypothetical protein